MNDDCRKITKKNASILLVTLFFLSTISLITSQLIRNILLSVQFSGIMMKKAQARALTLGALELARAELTMHLRKQGAKKGKSSQDPDQDAKDFLNNILPYLNRFRTFQLNEKEDGVNGEVKFCICCENGKININTAFDFDKKEFKEPYKSKLEQLILKGKKNTAKGAFLKMMTDFLAGRGKKLDDISQLLQIKDLGDIKIFYIPEKNKTTASIALSDIFTLWTDDEKIEPWLLSDTMCTILGIKASLENADEISKTVEKFKRNLGSDWKKNLVELKPIYNGIEKVLPDVQQIFTQQFDPTVYTVVCCGKVGSIKQYMLAVLVKEEQKNLQKPDPQNSNAKNNLQAVNIKYKIKQIYWNVNF